MIEATIYRNNKRPLGFRIKGHAGYAPLGQDIVCAAVSAIAQTTVLGLQSIAKPDLVISDGNLECYCTDEKGYILVDTLFLGLCDIANGYPKHVRVIEKEV